MWSELQNLTYKVNHLKVILGMAVKKQYTHSNCSFTYKIIAIYIALNFLMKVRFFINKNFIHTWLTQYNCLFFIFKIIYEQEIVHSSGRTDVSNRSWITSYCGSQCIKLCILTKNVVQITCLNTSLICTKKISKLKKKKKSFTKSFTALKNFYTGFTYILSILMRSKKIV